MFIEATLIGELDQQKVIERSEIKEAQIQKCFDILGLHNSKVNCNEIKTAYFKLSSIYHPDKDVNNREKYFQILSAYQTLDKYLAESCSQIKPSTELLRNELKLLKEDRKSDYKIEENLKSIAQSKENLENLLDQPNGSKETKKQYSEQSDFCESKQSSFQSKFKEGFTVIEEPLFLQYTVHIDWQVVLKSWVQGEAYKRIFRYSYIGKCQCEQICVCCKGTGYTVQRTYCSACNGKGSCNYCDRCSKTGAYTAKDHVELILEQGKKIPKRIVYPNKGDESNSIRKDLVLILKAIGSVSKIKDDLYIYRKYMQKKDLTGPTYVCAFLGRKIEIDLTKVRRIPYYQKIEGFSIFINSKRIRLYIMIGLDP